VSATDVDRFAAAYALGAEGPLQSFNEAGVLDAADVHVARRLGALLGTEDDAALLGAALAVRGCRLGHVCVELATVRSTVSTDDEGVDVGALPWPDGDWAATMATSALVGEGLPLRLEGTRLYLDRYWAAECQVAADLLALAAASAAAVDETVLAEGLARLFPEGEDPDLQRLAAASAVLRGVSVIAGGPGTGKTTTVARVLALLEDQATSAGSRPPLVALAAPTGKAAVRLNEAVAEEAGRLPIRDDQRGRLAELRGQTLHRLLGWSPNRTRFRHDRRNRLAHDVVVVDETSMVSLTHMARLVEAVRPDGRLILLGDPEQLASVEAGAVLGDLVGPATGGLQMRADARETLARVTAQQVPATEPASDTPIGDGIVVLRRVHRFGVGIAELADAVRRGDAEATLGVLSAGHDDVIWLPVGAAAGPEMLTPVSAAAVKAGRAVWEAAGAGAAEEALEALGSFRLLCAHRRGPEGAATWNQRIEGWLEVEVEGFGAEGRWYTGRPLLVTVNDYSLRLYNGDTGVVVAGEGGRPQAVFERGEEVVAVSPARLASVETVYAMTIHKSQGSQFATVAVLLPEIGSPILTRELLYTAVTRGQDRVMVVASEEAIVGAVRRPIARASGLRQRLWGEA